MPIFVYREAQDHAYGKPRFNPSQPESHFPSYPAPTLPAAKKADEIVHLFMKKLSQIKRKGTWWVYKVKWYTGKNANFSVAPTSQSISLPYFCAEQPANPFLANTSGIVKGVVHIENRTFCDYEILG